MALAKVSSPLARVISLLIAVHGIHVREQIEIIAPRLLVRCAQVQQQEGVAERPLAELGQQAGHARIQIGVAGAKGEELGRGLAQDFFQVFERHVHTGGRIEMAQAIVPLHGQNQCLARAAWHPADEGLETVGGDLPQKEIAEHVVADRADKTDLVRLDADLRQIDYEVDGMAAQAQLDRLGEILDHPGLGHLVEARGDDVAHERSPRQDPFSHWLLLGADDTRPRLV